MEYPLEKYKRFIEDTEKSPFFDKHHIRHCEEARRADEAISICREDKYSSEVVAKIVKSGGIFYIRYIYEGFNRVYDICENSPLVHKLRRISSRNSLTQEILEEVIKYQRRYLETADPIDLAPLSQVQFTNLLNTYDLQLTTDNSWISRLVSRLSIITPSGEEKPLKWFFPTQRELNKRCIKKLFEKRGWSRIGKHGYARIKTRRQRPKGVPSPSTSLRVNSVEGKSDREVKDLLKDKFGISVSRRTVCYCRKELGILPFGKRQLGDGYSAFAVNFSQYYPLALEAVTKYAPAKSGVYEFSCKLSAISRQSSALRHRSGLMVSEIEPSAKDFKLKAESRELKASRNTIFYIGSAKNIRKRLKGHLGQNRNSGIKETLKNYNCLFRYILFQKEWRKEEKRLYELFVQTFGVGPRCNRVSPVGN